MDWEKIEFDHTLITSQFLNDLQDYIIYLKSQIEELRSAPQLVPYREERSNILPTTEGATESVTLQGVLIQREVAIGDVLLGSDEGTLAVVTETDGQYATVEGLGERIAGA